MSRVFAVHASMLGMACQKAVEHRYINGIKRAPGSAAHIGTGVDRSVTTNLESVIKTGASVPLADARQRAADAFESAWKAEPPLLDEDELEEGEEAVKGKSKDLAITLAELHYTQAAPLIQPQAVQLALRIEDPGFTANVKGYDITVAVEGTVDVLDKRKIERDTKTAAKTPPEDAAFGHVQLGTYAMLLDAHGMAPEVVALDVLVKNKKPVYVKREAPAPTNHEPIIKRIAAFVRMLESGSFMPVNPDGPMGWACTQSACGYFDICEYGRARKFQQSVPKETK